MKNEKNNNCIVEDEIPNIQIADPYAYVSSERKIANIVIVSSTGQQIRPLIRTKNGKYMMQ